MKPHLDISLIIPTYNRLLKLFHLLKSISKLNPHPKEVIIIDDNSNDGTKRLLRKWKNLNSAFHKRVILKEKNRGPAHSRNMGIQESNCRLVGFVDDDVILKSDWVRKIIKPFIKKDFPKLAGVGGVIRSVGNDIISKYYIKHKILEAPELMNYLPTVNCCFKKKSLEFIDGFDESFPFAGGEDTDLGLRLKNKGYFFLKAKDAVVYHDFSSNFLDFCRTWVRYGKGTQLAVSNLRRLN